MAWMLVVPWIANVGLGLLIGWIATAPAGQRGGVRRWSGTARSRWHRRY